MNPERVAIRCPACEGPLSVTLIPATEEGEADEWMDGRGCPCEADSEHSVRTCREYRAAVLKRAKVAVRRRVR